MDINLRQLYHTALLDRGGDKWATCDKCGKKNTSKCEFHHIIQRSECPHVPLELISQPTLLAYLCPDCHDVAHNPEVKKELFLKNADRYGKQAIIDAVDDVERAMRSKLRFDIVNILGDI